MWSNFKISNNMSTGARKREDPSFVTPISKAARQNNSTMDVGGPPAGNTVPNGQGGVAGEVPTANTFAQGGAAGEVPPPNPFAQGGAAGGTAPQEPSVQGGAAGGTFPQEPFAPGGAWAGGTPKVKSTQGRAAGGTTRGTAAGVSFADTNSSTTAGKQRTYMKKVDLTMYLKPGEIPMAMARKYMALVGRIARKGLADKNLCYAPLRGSRPPLAPTESVLPNGMSDFLGYVHVHNGEQHKLTKKVGDAGWVATVTVNFFSFKKIDEKKLEACAGDILFQSLGEVELGLKNIPATESKKILISRSTNIEGEYTDKDVGWGVEQGLQDSYKAKGWTNEMINRRLIGKTCKVKTSVEIPPNAEWMIVDKLKAAKADWSCRQMIVVEVDALLLKDILDAAFYIQKRLRERLGRRLQILPVLTDKADAAQEAFFKASAEENMDVLHNLQGRIVGGHPTYEGFNTQMTLRYKHATTQLPHPTKHEYQSMRFLIMTQKISEDEVTFRKRYAVSSVQMGSGGALSVFYSADAERAEEAKQWGEFGPAKGFFYLLPFFVPYDIERLMLTAFKEEEVERLFNETVFDGKRVTFKTHVPEQAQTVQDVVAFDISIEDREEEVAEDNGDFDPDVESMRSKMPEEEDSPDEEVPAIPHFKTPREIIEEYRAFEREALRKANESSENPMETENAKESGDGTKTGTNDEGNAQGGAEEDRTKTDDDDEGDEDSLKSQN